MSDLEQSLEGRLVHLGLPTPRRFEYDYKSGLVRIDIMGETQFHYQVQAGLRDSLKEYIALLSGAVEDPILRQRIRSLKEKGTAVIENEDKLRRQADVSFGHPGALPSLVCEVS